MIIEIYLGSLLKRPDIGRTLEFRDVDGRLDSVDACDDDGADVS